MGRRKGQAQPPGVGGPDGKISRGLKKHYETNPRSEEHNRKISEGVRKSLLRRLLGL